MHRIRHLVAIVAMTAVSLGGCGDGDGDGDGATIAGGDPATTTTAFQSIEPGTFEPATEGTMVRWYEAAGECPECGFSIVFDASGTATYEGYQEGSSVAFDADELAARMTALDHQPITMGRDDCGREVDGNAPVLELTRADGSVLEIDSCYRPIDREHPIMQLVTTTLDAARTAAVSG